MPFSCKREACPSKFSPFSKCGHADMIAMQKYGKKKSRGLSDTKPIVCQHFCPTKDKNLPE